MRISPPRIGPTARPIADIPAQSPIARARSFSSLKVERISERVEGGIAPAPRPWIARAKIRKVALLIASERPDNAEPRMKTAIPSCSTRLRPNLSPIEAESRIVEPNMMM